jgi:hypothetical protein
MKHLASLLWKLWSVGFLLLPLAMVALLRSLSMVFQASMLIPITLIRWLHALLVNFFEQCQKDPSHWNKISDGGLKRIHERSAFSM